MPRLKVFISSAMRDDETAAERALAAEGVTEANCDPYLIELDTAKPAHVRDVYLRKVEECELFVLIVSRTLRPAVREEYDRAVATGKPILVFIRLGVEDRDQALTEFIERTLYTHVTPDDYVRPNDLQRAVKNALVAEMTERFKREGQDYLAKFELALYMEDVSTRLEEEQGKEHDPLPDYWTGTNATWEHILAHQDVRRDALMEEVWGHFYKSNLCVIRAESGQGKTSLMYRFACDNRDVFQVFEVRRLDEQGVRLTCLSAPDLSEDARKPLLLLMDDVTRRQYQGWEVLMEELRKRGDIFLLCTSREDEWTEDRIASFISDVEYVEPRLDWPTAEGILAALSERGLVRQGIDPNRAFKDSRGLLMEYVTYLTSGAHLQDLVAEQLARHREAATEETYNTMADILRVVSLFHAHGASCPTHVIEGVIGTSLSQMAAALRRLRPELLRESDSGWEMAHELRAIQTMELLHDRAGIPLADTLSAVLAVATVADMMDFLPVALDQRSDALEPAASQFFESLGCRSDPLDVQLRFLTRLPDDAVRRLWNSVAPQLQRISLLLEQQGDYSPLFDAVRACHRLGEDRNSPLASPGVAAELLAPLNMGQLMEWAQQEADPRVYGYMLDIATDVGELDRALRSSPWRHLPAEDVLDWTVAGVVDLVKGLTAYDRTVCREWLLTQDAKEILLHVVHNETWISEVMDLVEAVYAVAAPNAGDYLVDATLGEAATWFADAIGDEQDLEEAVNTYDALHDYSVQLAREVGHDIDIEDMRDQLSYLEDEEASEIASWRDETAEVGEREANLRDRVADMDDGALAAQLCEASPGERGALLAALSHESSSRKTGVLAQLEPHALAAGLNPVVDPQACEDVIAGATELDPEMGRAIATAAGVRNVDLLMRRSQSRRRKDA